MRGFALLAFVLALTSGSHPAQAQGKPKPHSAAQRKPPPKKPKKAKPEADKPDADSPSDDPKKSGALAGPDEPRAGPNAAGADQGQPSAVKTAGTSATKGAPNAGSVLAVQETKETREGVKTYKFGTIEVEGRLKSPQIIYFLRRVRAEFDAGLLGHRSFLLELSDTRNKQALR